MWWSDWLENPPSIDSGCEQHRFTFSKTWEIGGFSPESPYNLPMKTTKTSSPRACEIGQAHIALKLKTFQKVLGHVSLGNGKGHPFCVNQKRIHISKYIKIYQNISKYHRYAADVSFKFHNLWELRHFGLRASRSSLNSWTACCDTCFLASFKSKKKLKKNWG